MNATFAKAELGIVFGFALISTVHGEPFFDSQNDHVADDTILRAATAFVESGAMAKENHTGGGIGRVIFAFPLTAEIASALNIKTELTGLLIGMKPDDPTVVDRFRSGELTGFSIGGTGERKAA